MSRSAPQSKMPSPARTPRDSSDDPRPLTQRQAHKPAGIINLGMTCFLNSTFQALSATPQLIALHATNPEWSLKPSVNSILPPPPQSASLTPSLLPAASEPPLSTLLPVTRAFNSAIERTWATKDTGGPSISIKSLLKEMARKYDQYDEFAQQDAHELLRHLLDSMEMEEKDVIKRVQPAPPPRPLPTGSPPDGAASLSASIASLPASLPPADNIPDSERLLPFVHALFGGLLASIVVCETCKSVSHTYEGFLDLSLSLRGDDDVPRLRKRDRFRSITGKFKPRTVSSKLAGEPSATMSDPEAEPGERSNRKSKHHSVNSETENEQSGLGRSASMSKTFGGLKGRTSFSFRRKGGRSVSGAEKENGATSDTSAASTSTAQPSEPSLILEPVAEGDSAQAGTSSTPSEKSHAHHHHHHHHQAGPTPAQAAYIQRILYGPPGAPESHDPIAKLRAAHAGELGVGAGKPDSGLVDSLKAFTSVEVLEGENAFACRKCWKIKNGYYRDKSGARNWRRERKHGDGHKSETDHPTEVLLSPASSTSLLSPALSTSMLSPAASSGLLSPSPIKHSAPLPIPQADDDRPGRPRLAGRSPGIVRAPSPLRQRIEKEDDHEHIPISRFDTTKSSETTISLSSLNTTSSAETQTSSTKTVPTLDTIPTIDIGAEADGECESESDGLSNTDTEDESTPSLPKPSPSGRSGFFHYSRKDPAKDKNFILRRAFKRYLIAEAPETLVFHLKRFKQTGKSGMYSNFSTLKKMDDFVSFPEMLDLAPFFAPNRSDFKLTRTPGGGVHAPFMDWASPEKGPDVNPVWYKLYAVVVHLGTMVGGHYIAYVLVDPERMFADPRQPDQVSDITAAAERLSDLKLGDAKIRGRDRRVWCYCSDTEVRFASVDEVMNARAYLCFYEKVRVQG
ncbi:hypothetical protein Q8F55_006177 [Vanrija albida]|uniref:Ubiquitin carboxyl-terminal hydrolase n=1 Tax=Vanrija albida TaxID=181172 RepID=A0ABR3PWP3_9TREE